MNKKELRRQLRAARRSLPQTYQTLAAENLKRQVINAHILTRYHKIGFYLSFDSEIDLLPLLNYCLWRGKACFLPILPSRFQRRLRFSKMSGNNRWYHNRFNILEYWAARSFNAAQLDLLFIPLVGFDLEGYRLGMGGGFYDATLSYLRTRRRWHKPLLVGVAYECQKVSKLPHEPWDIKLDAVMTEANFYRFK